MKSFSAGQRKRAIVSARAPADLITGADREVRLQRFERHAGAASGINNTIARAAGLLAIALFGAISISSFARALDARLAGESSIIRREILAQKLQLAAAAAPRNLDEATQRRIRAAISDSFLRAFRINMFAAAALSVASAGAALAIRGKKDA